MKLFNVKTLKRHLAYGEIPPVHRKLLADWRELITSNRVKNLKEVSLHGDFTAKIVEGVLGYKGPTTQGIYTVSSEQNILRGSVDLALGHFGDLKPQIIAPLELKGANTRDLDAIMPNRAKSPVQQAWEYASGVPGVKWVLVSNYLELRLYGFGEGTEAYERFDLAQLTEPEEYARFTLLLSAENLLSGRTLQILAESRREDKDITDALYVDYKDLRATLIDAIRTNQPVMDALQSIGAAQTLLDRVLFIAFAEDNGLLPHNILQQAFEQKNAFSPQPIWANFQGLFRAIDQGSTDLNIPRYNGGLFAPDPAIDALQIPDEICGGFKRLGDYDFASEVTVTVLGHIFEQSIADVERLQALARGEQPEEKRTGTTGRRKRDGVVYTPDYIARFIAAKTLGAHLREIFAEVLSEFSVGETSKGPYEEIKWKRKSAEREAWESYRDRLQKLRIVDPACGSGVFLVMAFDFMKAELSRVNDKIAVLSGKGLYGDLLDPDSEILSNNIFGVDVNAESVEIAKLSLWLKTARRGKILDSLSETIKVGDSLIEDSNYAYLAHGFTWAAAFPQVFADGGFDIVLGNPPYVRMERLKAIKPYLEKRFEVVADRADLYAYFFERGLKLLKSGGRLGFISSSTFFKTRAGKPLRQYLLREAAIEAVTDFGGLQIFEGVTTYPAILVMKRGTPDAAHMFRSLKLNALPQQNFSAVFAEDSIEIAQASLSAATWALEGPDLQRLRQKLTTGRSTLREVYGAPFYGIKTGMNDAFVIDTPTKNRLCHKDPASLDLLRPFLEGRDLKRWHTEPRGLWIIYIPKNRVDINKYPAIRDWLIQFKKKLEDRATKQEWFELQQAQEAYSGPISKPKISYPHFNMERNFSLELTGAFSNDKTYFIPSDDLFLLAYLNSRLAWFIISKLAPAVRGGFHELRVEYMQQLPIPETTKTQKEVLADLASQCQRAAAARFNLQQAFRRRIPDLSDMAGRPTLSSKLHEWWKLVDFAALRAEVRKCLKVEIPLSERNEWEDWFARDRVKIATFSEQIAYCERQIDRVVFEIFGLEKEEVALLEFSLSTDTSVLPTGL